MTRIVNTKNPSYLRKIGYFFEKGLGVESNKEKAFEFYLKSARFGDYISQYNVAICYLNGVGIEKDVDKAITIIKSQLEDFNLKVKLEADYCVGDNWSED